MNEETTLYRLPDGEPVVFNKQHAENLLAYEKKIGVTCYSATQPVAPTDETNRPAGDTDGNETSPGPSEGA